MIKKRHVLHLAMGVVMTSLLGSCAADEIVGGAGSGNGVLSFGVEVNAGASEVKPMGGATRAADKADGSVAGDAVMSTDVEGFFPTSSVALSSVDGNAIYANCDERSGIRMHNNVDYKATRGSIQTQENFYTTFNLYGYVYDSSSEWASVSGSTYVDTNINGIAMIKGNGNDYNAYEVYWPGASKNATFFAVAPSTAKPNVSAVQGGPKITYTVPQSVESQEDLLLAVAKDIKCDGSIAPQLTFNHALAAIQFVKGENLGDFTDITKVEISGVKNNGKLSSFDTPEWTEQAIDGNVANTYTITNLNDVMFLMPQTVPTTGAKLKVTFSDGTNTKDFEADLNGTTWQAGHQYTYKLSVNKVTGTFNFEVTANSTSVNKDGGSVTFNVKSYFHYNDGTKDVPIAWQAKDSDSKVILNGAGGTSSTTTNSITIDANTAASSDHKENLQSVQFGTSEDYHDLSYDYDPSKRWTANCYVVNGWGYFKLPLVYGNAIKNGETNAAAYTANTESPNTANDFCNRDGNAITDETIIITALSGSTITAKVEWQYVNNLASTSMVTIDKVEPGSDGYTYLYFHIEKDAIDQGNALISVSDNGGVLWSWHIWVTDMPWKETNTYTDTDNTYSYSFMKMPLGMVDLNPTFSAATPRILNYTFSQTPSNGKSVVVSINQAGDSYPTNTTCTFYQWGRKDPFRPQNISGANGNKSYKEAIKYPTKFYIGASYDWSSGHSYQLWNARNTSTSDNYTSIKTIYDPCPPGFKVAPQQAYNIMVNNCGTFNWVNDSGTSTGGRLCSSTSDYWRAFGYLNYSSGSLEKAGNNGFHWSAGPYSNNSGFHMYFQSSGNALPTNRYYTRACGYSVRPVSE